MRDELWKPDVNAQGNPSNGISDEGNMFDGLNLTYDVQQNPVRIVG